ncbi:uncharacterized protein ARMOST_15064 [Armillaria ostoyae]|uniref:Nephrocystin 3-like N-terminal domain-containing protein n=1 Tax=Armillaria ostoyae TaxID=47428 RepID=A0A284RSE2_ARMOS|nr:uncharacterized protein ARMOST_15064 [Armillaria ostoyae]
MMEDITLEPRLIKDMEVQGFAPSVKNFRLQLDIIAAGVAHSYPTISLDHAVPTWTVNLDLGYLEATAEVELKLYRRIMWSRAGIFGHTTKTISDLFGEVPNCQTVPLYDTRSSVVASLRLSCSEDTRVLSVRNMIRTLAEVDHVADVAWSFLSKGIDVLRKRADADRFIVDLYNVMFSAYVTASHEEVRKQPRSFFESLLKQMIECSLFIERYVRKNGEGHPLSTIHIDKAAEFKRAFQDMNNAMRKPDVVTLGVQKPVNPFVKRELLDRLHISIDTAPQATCLLGTQREAINALTAWIAECSGRIFLCYGISGSGKTSLMCTLRRCELVYLKVTCDRKKDNLDWPEFLHAITPIRELAIHASGRNRLGAFISYNHMESSDSSTLFTTIAYSLATFDNRISEAILRALRSHETLPSSAKEQFQLFIQQPLQSIPDLADEGPNIIIIDGLDACDPSREVLTVLAKEFGTCLPFLRLVVSSRPVECITKVFHEVSQSDVESVSLDTSDTATHDIRCYVDYHVSAMFADMSERNEPNNSREMFEALHAAEVLSKRAKGSFIWAATVCRFIREIPSPTRLLALLGIPVCENATDALTALYRTVMDTTASEATDKEVATRMFRDVLGAILVSGAPEGMTVKALDALLLPEDPPRTAS